MTPQNAEIARRWCTAMEQGPEETRAALADFADPDFDFYPVGKYPDAQPCHGQEEFFQFLLRFWDSYSQSAWAIKKVIEVDDHRVLVLANLQAEGRASGMNLEGDVYICFWFRHGRFFRLENHVTLRGAIHSMGLEGETLEAAGLSE